MEKPDYDKKRYTQMKILKQDMEIMKKEIEQLKDALKQKVEQKVEIPEIPEIIEIPRHYGIDIAEMEIPVYKDPTKFTRHQISRTFKTMKKN
jgi:hypothetical protein